MMRTFLAMRRINKDRLTAILMLSPSILVLAVFIYGFIGQTVYISMTDWGTNPNKPPLAENVQLDFVGLKNYQNLFAGLLNTRFRIDLVNTIFFTVLFLVACLVLGLIMAILLDQRVRGEGVFRTVFLFPMALSFVVTGTVWRWLFQPDGGLNILPTVVGLPALQNLWFIDKGRIVSFTWRDGLLIMSLLLIIAMLYLGVRAWAKRRRMAAVYLFVGLGLVGGLFFAGAFNVPLSIAREAQGLNVAIIAIVIAVTWQMSGYTMAIYLAGLRAIPDELREAARVDGCNEFQVYRYVVLPLLQPITFSAAIVLGHISLKIFDLVYVMAGAHNFQVDVLGVNMYNTTFQENNFAVGAAIAVIMLILVTVIIVPYLFNVLRGEPQL